MSASARVSKGWTIDCQDDTVKKVVSDGNSLFVCMRLTRLSFHLIGFCNVRVACGHVEGIESISAKGIGCTVS